MKRPKFSIRTILIVMAFAGIMTGWAVDRYRLSKEIDELSREVERLLILGQPIDTLGP